MWNKALTSISGRCCSTSWKARKSSREMFTYRRHITGGWGMTSTRPATRSREQKLDPRREKSWMLWGICHVLIPHSYRRRYAKLRPNRPRTPGSREVFLGLPDEPALQQSPAISRLQRRWLLSFFSFEIPSGTKLFARAICHAERKIGKNNNAVDTFHKRFSFAAGVPLGIWRYVSKNWGGEGGSTSQPVISRRHMFEAPA